MSKFETDKWYYFKDNVAESRFRNGYSGNSDIADIIVRGEGFKPLTIKAGDVYEVALSYGDDTRMELLERERCFFTEIPEIDAEEDEYEDCDDSDEQPSEPSEFPLTKITISNNSEAWTVYQMLKAHFKE